MNSQQQQLVDRLKVYLERYKYDGLLVSDYEIKPTKLPRKKKKQAKKNRQYHCSVILSVPLESVKFEVEMDK